LAGYRLGGVLRFVGDSFIRFASYKSYAIAVNRYGSIFIAIVVCVCIALETYSRPLTGLMRIYQALGDLL
jgi:hypothetical protein